MRISAPRIKLGHRETIFQKAVLLGRRNLNTSGSDYALIGDEQAHDCRHDLVNRIQLHDLSPEDLVAAMRVYLDK